MMIANLDQVTKRYPSASGTQDVTILDNISLSIQEKESIAITGPSGSGKSTLLNILGTLDEPTSGNITILGQKPDKLNAKALAFLRNQTIGFVFQLHHLLPQLNVRQNILLPLLPIKDIEKKKAAEYRATYLLDRVGLTDHQFKFPSMLSVGECQRVAIVRALINSPVLLLADEPTGSLDSKNAAQVIKLLHELQKEDGFAMVLVTHSDEMAASVQQVYSLSSGQLVKQNISIS
jgi:ABC-type lipoprotein export system ATPase subunit